MLHSPKQEFQLTSQQPVSGVYAPSADHHDHCDLMTAEAINCPLPVSVDTSLDASQSSRQIGPESQSLSDICLGGESFLQSLEAIPLPSLGQNEASKLYNPMSTYPDLYTNAAAASEAKHGLSGSSSSMQQQQEILQAWGSAGPSTNFNPNSGVGFAQMPFVPTENHPVLLPRSIPRAFRSRGRGRGLRRKIGPLNGHGRVGGPSFRSSFSPRCGPPPPPPPPPPAPVRQTSIRAETMTASTQSYLTVMSNQLPPQPPPPPPPSQNHQSNGPSSLPMRDPPATACRQQSSEMTLNSEEFQANEKMNAYIEKFSSESCELFGPLISIDTSRKPSTLQEAISMYIDFVVLENEKRTRISCCNVLPMPLDFHKEDYYHEIMCQPIAFPTPKFRDWLKLYNVDIEITDPDGQTVSQTTFPPAANFANDMRVSVPTSLHMINWQQQTRGIPSQSGVASPRLNLPGVLRGRPKSRTVAGQAVRFGHPGMKGVAGHPPLEFLHSSPADQAANVRFLRGNMGNNNCGSVHPGSMCGGVMHHQFQTISLPTLGSMQYFGQGPMPTSIQRPCPEMSTNNSLQMINSFQGVASAHASNYYRMGPLFNPYPNEMTWRNCCSRAPNLLHPDHHKTNAYTEMEAAENLAAYMNRPETMMSSVDNTSMLPSVMSMLPPFSSFVNGSAANLPNEPAVAKGHLPAQSADSCSKTCQIGEPAVFDHVQALNFAREQDRGGASTVPSVSRGSCLSAGDACAPPPPPPAAQFSTQDPRFNWNEGAKVYSRPGSGPAIKEMVDQGCQTEVDKVITEDARTAELRSGSGRQEEEEEEASKEEGEQFGGVGVGVGFDSSICSFSCNDDFDEARKAEDQLNSEMLLRNASIILNGSMEADDAMQIQAPGFEASSSQEDLLLNNSQASTLGDLDGLALSGDCGMHSFMTVNLTCSSEDPPKSPSGDEMMASPQPGGDDDGCGRVDTAEEEEGYDDDEENDDDDGVAAENVVEVNKSSDLLLEEEVGSNVEINTDGIATAGVGGGGGGGSSEYHRWVEPRRKRARFSRVGNRQMIVVGHQQHPWSIARAQNRKLIQQQQHHQQQQTMTDERSPATEMTVESTIFEDEDQSATDDNL